MAERHTSTFVAYDDGPDTVDGATAAAAPETICETVAAAAAANDLPLAFFLRLIWQESRFDPLAISRAGAQGVAQFMPRVATAMGLADPFDPAQALPISARFLNGLRQQFGNLGLAAAAYNAGSGRIQNWLAKRSKLPKETRDYVMNITGHAPERWIKTASNSISLKVPASLPCRMPEAALAAAVPMPPERPEEVSPGVLAFADPETERVSVPLYRPALRWRAESARQVSAPTPVVRAPRVQMSSATLVVHKISGKGSKVSISTHQQRAIIFVNRKPDAVRVKLADQRLPAGRVQAKLAAKERAPAKLADKGAPQRVRVALATRR